MYSDNSNLSGVHKFLRESKALYPARLTYAQINDTVRFGPKYESEKVKTSIRRKINNRNYRKKLIISEDEVSRQQEREFHEPKLISIIVPLYNTKKEFLIEMIESVINQTYDNYQLCLADGSDEDNSHVEKIVKSYIKNNTKIKYKKLKENGGISVNTNECIKLATGDYILLFDHDDVLHESLLYELMDRIEETKADFIYTDEAIFTNDITKPFGYHFKPDYSLHALRSNNYICHASCFSRELFEKAGDFRKEFDGSQDHDLILRLTEKADRIEHISKVLYFWRCHEESVASDISAKTYAIDAGINAVKAHLERNNILGTVESSPVFPVIYDVKYKIKGDPKVSIIVTSTGNARECVKNIKKNTSYANKEIFVCKSLEKRNAAAKSANGDYIVFVDDRLRFSDKHWLKNLLGVCMQKNSGAVSGKIIYKNGILRDAGIVLGAGANGIGANVLFRYKGDNEGYLGNMYFNREVSAVCDNLLMISKDNFLKVEGFNETLPEWYAGIDLSIKLNKTGVNNIVAPYVTATFMEKEKERGISGNFPSYSDLDEEFMEKHKEALSKPDPYYNENFDKRAANFIIKKIE